MSAPRPPRSPFRAPALVALASLVACGELAEAPAVRLEGRALTVEDLRIAYADLDAAARPPLATREQRKAFARRVVERLLLVEEGRRLLEEDGGDPAADVDRERRLVMVRRLRVLVGAGPEIDSAAVAAAHDRMRTRSRVETAFFAREEDAQAARARLDTGEPFASLLRRGGRGEGGEIWVVWSPLPDPVADAVVDLPVGRAAGPLRVGGGWRLVRVVDRAPNDPGPLEEQRSRILVGLKTRREAGAVESLAARLRGEADVRIDDAAIDLLATRTREAILRPGAAEQEADWAVPALAAAEESTVVATWRGGRLDAGDHVRLTRRESRGQRPRAMLRAEVRRAVDQEITFRLLAAEAEQRGIAEDWWVLRALARAREERSIQRAVVEIGRQTESTTTETDSLAALLLETQPDLFRREARARVLRLDASDRATAEAEVARVRRAGGTRARLVEMLDSEVPLDVSYHLFWLTPSELSSPAMVADLFESGDGAVSGPHRIGDVWVVYGCLEVVPPTQPSREEVFADVRSRMSAGSDPRRVAAWVDRRAREQGLAIDEDVLDGLAPGG